MYGENHNQCARHKTGTYKTDVRSFMKAYVRQKEQMAENYGIEYEAPGEDVMMYLNCQQVYLNNIVVSASDLIFARSFSRINLISIIHSIILVLCQNRV